MSTLTVVMAGTGLDENAKRLGEMITSLTSHLPPEEKGKSWEFFPGVGSEIYKIVLYSPGMLSN